MDLSVEKAFGKDEDVNKDTDPISTIVAAEIDAWIEFDNLISEFVELYTPAADLAEKLNVVIKRGSISILEVEDGIEIRDYRTSKVIGRGKKFVEALTEANITLKNWKIQRDRICKGEAV